MDLFLYSRLEANLYSSIRSAMIRFPWKLSPVILLGIIILNRNYLLNYSVLLVEIYTNNTGKGTISANKRHARLKRPHIAIPR